MVLKVAGFLEKLSNFVVATAEQTSPPLRVRDTLPLSAMTLRVDLMLESGPLSIVGWMSLGNPGPARLILHHLEGFPPEPTGSALKFDTLRSWDLFSKDLPDVNILQPIVRPALPLC